MIESEEITYLNKHVRNLFWLVYSPCLETGVLFEHADMWLPHELMDDWKSAHLNWFDDLDRHAHLLEEFLAEQLKSIRLGMYAEKLLQFYFLHAPGFELLSANEQVPPTGITRSEIDFCVKWSQRIIHIELAVKFFLETNDKQWVGPNRRDSLAQKWHKIHSIQIPTARQTLVDRYGDQVASYVMMKGYLFRHHESANCWYTLSEFEQYNWEGARFAFPEKSEWMTAFQGYTGKTMNTRNSLTYIRAHFIHSTNSLTVVVLSKRGQQNLFIVKDNW